MSTCVTAVEHIRKLRGGSQPHLLVGSDGACYVTKFANNPQHIRVLANEMFAGLLGRHIGLPFANLEIMDVPERFVRNTPELRFQIGRGAFPCCAGKQFASRYVSDPTKGAVHDFLPEHELERVSNLADFARVLVLDKWAANCDGRQAVFTRDSVENDRYSATFVDHGFCFNAGEWNFPDAPLRGSYARSCVYSVVTGWDDFQPALSRAEEMSMGEIWRFARQIPEEWYEHDLEGLGRISAALYRRRSLIRALITDFRNSSRNPFPNWSER